MATKHVITCDRCGKEHVLDHYWDDLHDTPPEWWGVKQSSARNYKTKHFCSLACLVEQAVIWHAAELRA